MSSDSIMSGRRQQEGTCEAGVVVSDASIMSGKTDLVGEDDLAPAVPARGLDECAREASEVLAAEHHGAQGVEEAGVEAGRDQDQLRLVRVQRRHHHLLERRLCCKRETLPS